MALKEIEENMKSNFKISRFIKSFIEKTFFETN
jgi:hypothetical protein